MSLVLVFNDMCIRASEWVHASVANVVSVYVCVCGFVWCTLVRVFVFVCIYDCRSCVCACVSCICD